MAAQGFNPFLHPGVINALQRRQGFSQQPVIGGPLPDFTAAPVDQFQGIDQMG